MGSTYSWAEMYPSRSFQMARNKQSLEKNIFITHMQFFRLELFYLLVSPNNVFNCVLQSTQLKVSVIKSQACLLSCNTTWKIAQTQNRCLCAGEVGRKCSKQVFRLGPFQRFINCVLMV